MNLDQIGSGPSSTRPKAKGKAVASAPSKRTSADTGRRRGNRRSSDLGPRSRAMSSPELDPSSIAAAAAAGGSSGRGGGSGRRSSTLDMESKSARRRSEREIILQDMQKTADAASASARQIMDRYRKNGDILLNDLNDSNLSDSRPLPSSRESFSDNERSIRGSGSEKNKGRKHRKSLLDAGVSVSAPTSCSSSPTEGNRIKEIKGQMLKKILHGDGTGPATKIGLVSPDGTRQRTETAAGIERAKKTTAEGRRASDLLWEDDSLEGDIDLDPLSTLEAAGGSRAGRVSNRMRQNMFDIGMSSVDMTGLGGFVGGLGRHGNTQAYFDPDTEAAQWQASGNSPGIGRSLFDFEKIGSTFRDAFGLDWNERMPSKVDMNRNIAPRRVSGDATNIMGNLYFEDVAARKKKDLYSPHCRDACMVVDTFLDRRRCLMMTAAMATIIGVATYCTGKPVEVISSPTTNAGVPPVKNMQPTSTTSTSSEIDTGFSKEEGVEGSYEKNVSFELATGDPKKKQDDSDALSMTSEEKRDQDDEGIDTSADEEHIPQSFAPSIRFNEIKLRLIEEGITHEKTLNPSNKMEIADKFYLVPQRRALEWLADEDKRQLPVNHPFLSERFALACFWYSTYDFTRLHNQEFDPTPTNWIRSNHWMSEEPICEWLGVTCHEGEGNDKDGSVKLLEMSHNGIYGYITDEVKAGLKNGVYDLLGNHINNLHGYTWISSPKHPN